MKKSILPIGMSNRFGHVLLFTMVVAVSGCSMFGRENSYDAKTCPGTAHKVREVCGCRPQEGWIITQAALLGPALEQSVAKCLKAEGSLDKGVGKINGHLSTCVQQDTTLEPKVRDGFVKIVQDADSKISAEDDATWRRCYTKVTSSAPSSDTSELANQMYVNLTEKHYSAAIERADEILKNDPRNYRALNVKGTVAYYRRNWQDAVKYFSQAVDAKPGDPVIGKNLAEAYVEIGAYDLALKTYEKTKTGSPEWFYGYGRALLFKGNYHDALENLQAINGALYKGSNYVLIAAALVGEARLATPTAERTFKERAKEELKRACESDDQHWNEILTGKGRNIHETYEKVIPLLQELYVGSKPCG